ncbi:CHAD domain-containing protein [Haloferula sp.]|uniref:CHAD domain-containing protein n=1 Tax=Haloferula sp. TaxID=2497595 RepID=UPI00329E5BF5
MSDSPYTQRWHCVGFKETTLKKVLGTGYRVEAGKVNESQVELYDSFDRSFVSDGLALMRIKGRFRVVDGEDLESHALESDQVIRHHRPIFHWDFEAGSFRRILRSHLKFRAAVQLVKIKVEEREFCVRNDDEKIILRLWFKGTRVGDKLVAGELRSSHLLGYENQEKEIAKRLSKVPEFSGEARPLAEVVLEASGAANAYISAKQAIHFSPESTAQQAVTEIARLMMQVARQNEPGVIDDIDTEHLHDYRVSIRKLRSVFTLVKGVYPEKQTQELKTTFGDLFRVTSRLRDLDVYLLEEAEYRRRLPDCLSPGLDRMFADFRAERRRELGKLRKRFQSPEYRKQMDRQFKWFGRAKLPSGEIADLPMGEVAAKEIWKHYKLVRGLGVALTDETPEEEVHELRKQCKKLRYLLELFSSLFSEKALKSILRRLRGLQNTLGDFNDYSVQSESMLEYLEKAKKMDKDSASSVGGLIAVLHLRKHEARAQVAERFEEFCDGNMKRRFKKLFSSIRKSGS